MRLFHCWKNSDSKIPDEKRATPWLSTHSFWHCLHSYPHFKNASVGERRAYLKFLQEVVKQDLVVHAATGLLAKPVTRHIGLFPDLPQCCSMESERIPFDGKTVVAPAYQHNKFFPAILDVMQAGICPKKNYFSGYYFPDWELILIVNGIHHAAVESVLKRGGGSAECYTINLQKAYENLGLSQGLDEWVWSDGRQEIVAEPRIALLYAISRELNELSSIS